MPIAPTAAPASASADLRIRRVTRWMLAVGSRRGGRRLRDRARAAGERARLRAARDEEVPPRPRGLRRQGERRRGGVPRVVRGTLVRDEPRVDDRGPHDPDRARLPVLRGADAARCGRGRGRRGAAETVAALAVGRAGRSKIVRRRVRERRGDMPDPRTHAAERRRVFRRLHESGCFVIPNPWDRGSAALLVHLGFRALATTSAGFAWSRGRRDGGVGLEEALDHFRDIAARGPGSGQRRLRGRLRGRAGARRRERRARGGDRRGRALDRGLDGRRRRAAPSLLPRRRAGARRAGGDRRLRRRSGGPAHGALRGIHPRPSGSLGDDPAADGVRRGGRGLSVRARHRARATRSRRSSRRFRPGRSTSSPGDSTTVAELAAPRRAADQRRRLARAHGLDGIPRRGAGDRGARHLHEPRPGGLRGAS